MTPVHVMSIRAATTLSGLLGVAWYGVRLLADQTIQTWTEGGIALLFFASLIAGMRIMWQKWQEDRDKAALRYQELESEVRKINNQALDEAKERVAELEKRIKELEQSCE